MKGSGQVQVTAVEVATAGQWSGLVAVLGKGSPECANTPWNPMLLTVTLGPMGTLNRPPERSELRFWTAYS